MALGDNAAYIHGRSIMFNTGDLCRWRPDGSMAHEGRADDQVKIKVRIVVLDAISKPLTMGRGSESNLTAFLHRWR